MMTKTEAEAIATLVHTLRPDWDHRGVMAALAQVRDKQPFAVALAAVRAARIAANRTPAVIPLAGFHWQEPGATSTPATWRMTRPVLDPELAAKGAAAAKAELLAAKQRAAAERAERQARIEAARTTDPEETA